MRLVLLSLLLLVPAFARAQASNAPVPAAIPTSAPVHIAAPTSAPAVAVAPAKSAAPVPAPASTDKALASKPAAKQKPASSASKADETPEVVPTAPKMKPESPDARFDKTGDGLVDAADWALMSDKEKRAYARASLKALGENPDAPVGNGKTRLDLYLSGLRAVYH